MDCLTSDAESESLQIDVKRVVDFLRYRRVKKLYVTGHPESITSPFGAMWRSKVTIFLRKLFEEIKSMVSPMVSPDAIQEVVTTPLESPLQSTNLSFMTQSPTVTGSPFTPILCSTEVVKPLFEESKIEIVPINNSDNEKGVDTKRALVYFDPSSLESKIMQSLNEIDSYYSPKRQRND